MLADHKFRFSLQWGSDTAEKVQAGELLEHLRNKKSEFIVLAVAEYLRNHPDIMRSSGKIRIEVQPVQSPDQLWAMVEEMAKAALEPMIAGKQLIPADTSKTQEDLADMLANLDAFK